jgi:exo-beta-1,3-glucanase (GH17 family)
MKKYMYSCAAMAMAMAALLSPPAFASPDYIKGINYDPVHSIEFAAAVGNDDADGMANAIKLDLDKLKELHAAGFGDIRVLKTFFSSYSSLGVNKPPVVIKIADVVSDWNAGNPENAVRLALGVYEFDRNKDACHDDPTCESWTAAQVADAIASANKYPGLVSRIVVGNENLSKDDNGRYIEKRMASDIVAIRNGLNDKAIKLGTAQTAAGGSDLASGSYPDLKNVIDFLGVNVYPYWSGTPYDSAKSEMENYWKNFPRVSMDLVETEEGWPSGGDMHGNAIPSGNNLHDYFYYWYHRNSGSVPRESYYFALFDKTPGQGTESHWGLFSADRYSGILGSSDNWSKPLSPENKTVTFVNSVVRRKVAVNACTEDWNGNGQGACYPIDGYVKTGDIGAGGSRDMMIETGGKNYKSLVVTYYPDANQQLRLCYVDHAMLNNLRDGARIPLRWVNDSGNVPCY